MTAAAPALTARSVLVSTLLGTHPPRLPSRVLVAAGELFGVSEGTVRTALSRMVAAGEVRMVDGWYELAGPLLERQQRQDRSRVDATHGRAEGRADEWDGAWVLAVVRDERRDAARRGDLRDAMRRLQLAEIREGVWTRPDNLPADRLPDAAEVLADQCRTFRSVPDEPAADLAATLWDLGSWATTARSLTESLDAGRPALEAGDPGRLRDGFVLSATVLRHLLADPSLPSPLLPPAWPGPSLRHSYERFDVAFKVVLRDWLKRHTSTAAPGAGATTARPSPTMTR